MAPAPETIFLSLAVTADICLPGLASQGSFLLQRTDTERGSASLAQAQDRGLVSAGSQVRDAVGSGEASPDGGIF